MSEHRDRDLLEEAQALRERAAAGATSKADLEARYGILAGPVAATRKVLAACRAAMEYIGPLGRAVIWVATTLGAFLSWAVFEREDGQQVRDEDGRRQFSLARLGFVALGALASGMALHATAAAVYFYSTAFSETVYVTGKQEIVTGELYQVGGCTSLPCSTELDNGKFYLIEASLYFPTLIYPEEEVFANIPQQHAACDIDGYGIYFRSMRWLYKSAQLYQHAVRVSCRPYTAEEIERAVGTGTIAPTQQ